MNNILSKLALCSKKPKLCLHSCCGPCSTSAIDRLMPYFDISIFYYNPNIFPAEEYEKRKSEQKRFASINNIKVIDCDYDYNIFLKRIKGFESCKEGETRCKICYQFRMEMCAKYGKENGYDYFCSTLSVSPHKNSIWINEIGFDLEKSLNINYLPNDFKKQDGYLKSLRFSSQYNLYRQNYCGCAFSLNVRNE